jgi:DNA-binding LacI/PurR family transcriptional regulator
MRTVLQHGVTVPGQVSVTGFDAIPEGELYWPGLTTVRQPSQAMGSAACRALLAMIDDDTAEPIVRHDLPAELVVRESTGVAPPSAP